MRVVAFERDRRMIHHFADGGLFGRSHEAGPSRLFRYPEDIFRAAFIGTLRVRRVVVALALDEPDAHFLECVGDSGELPA